MHAIKNQDLSVQFPIMESMHVKLIIIIQFSIEGIILINKDTTKAIVKMPQRKFSEEIYEYRIRSNCYITTTRFDNKTYDENINFRQQMNPSPACIYNCIQPVSQYISAKIDIYVLEMNNETNRIMGIGMIKNEPIYNKYKIHAEEKYNTFSYIGNDRIDRNDLTVKEEQIMKVFDILCFKGKRHMKRLKGIKCFPIDMLYNCKNVFDLVDFVCKSFLERRLQR